MKIHKPLVFATMMLAISLSVPAVLPAQQPPTPVFVANVERKTFIDEVEAIGTLHANENVDLMTTVTELITKINFEDGQRVRKGDILVEMDAAEELAEKAEELYRITEAEKQVNRLEPLIARGAASKAILDEQRRNLQTAQARLNAIASRISKRLIVAPFDGVVGLRNISVGALAQPGIRIATIDDDSIMKLDFAVPEVFLATLKPGIRIVATASAYPGETFEGEIASMDSRVNPVTRSIMVRAMLKNDDQKLKPGMLMRVVLQKNRREALVIPEESLIPDGDRHFVFITAAGDEKMTVERRSVTIGARRKGEVEILAGVEEGQQVVTHGTLRIRPGIPITIRAVERGDESLTDLLNQNTSRENIP